jgi:hypothetical protein
MSYTRIIEAKPTLSLCFSSPKSQPFHEAAFW